MYKTQRAIPIKTHSNSHGFDKQTRALNSNPDDASVGKLSSLTLSHSCYVIKRGPIILLLLTPSTKISTQYTSARAHVQCLNDVLTRMHTNCTKHDFHCKRTLTHNLTVQTTTVAGVVEREENLALNTRRLPPYLHLSLRLPQRCVRSVSRCYRLAGGRGKCLPVCASKFARDPQKETSQLRCEPRNPPSLSHQVSNSHKEDVEELPKDLQDSAQILTLQFS